MTNPKAADRASSSPSSRPGWGRVMAWLFSLAVIGGGGFLATSATRPSPAEETAEAKKPLPVEVETVVREMTYSVSREYVGRVEAARDSQLAFERGGMIAEVLVDEGDHVDCNQPVAKLDTKLLDVQKQLRQAAVDAERARLAELETGPRIEQIAAAEAVVTQLQTDLRLARLTEARQRRLYEAGSTTEQRYDDARLAAESVAARLQSAEAQLDELNNGTRAEQITAQKAALALAEAQLQSVEVDLKKSVLRAPFAGRIASRLVDEGEVVAAGAPAVRLMELQNLEVRVALPSEVIDRLKPLDTCPLSVSGYQLDGVVDRITPERDATTRTIDVLFTVSSPEGPRSRSTPTIRPGDLATIRLDRPLQGDGFWIPLDGLVEGVRGLWSCYVVESRPEAPSEQVVVRRPLEVLTSDQSRAYVSGPVRDGEQVVVAGIHRLVPGQAVTVAQRDPQHTAAAD